jgi:hypothetical protein
MIHHDDGMTLIPPGYFYQSGHFYSHRPLKEATHTLRTFGPGLHHHLALFDPVGGTTVSVKTAPDGRFTLFD